MSAKDLRNAPQLRMPKSPDSVGIVFEGLVLNGKASVQEAHLKLPKLEEYPGIPLRDRAVPLPWKRK